MDIKTKFDLGLFLDDCNDGTKKVVVLDDAVEDANRLFKLPTDKEVISFIANDGIEKNLRYLGPDPLIKIKIRGLDVVDQYDFDIGSNKGYVAFGQSYITQKWIIKSFHLQERMLSFPPLENAMRIALGKKRK